MIVAITLPLVGLAQLKVGYDGNVIVGDSSSYTT